MSCTVEVVTVVRASREVLFDLELDMDAHSASLAGTRETAVTSSGLPALRLGDHVTFTARHFGRPWRMTAQVVEYQRPSRFVDEQVRGPFRSLRHEHEFTVIEPGSTRMRDRMTIALPLGLAGRAVARLVVGPYLARLLRQRGQAVKAMAEAREPPT